MRTLAEIRRLLASHREELRRTDGVRRLALFGSYVRGEQSAVSDVDILVDLEHPLGWEIVDLRDRLETILGIRVDLVTLRALQRKPLLWESVREELVDV